MEDWTESRAAGAVYWRILRLNALISQGEWEQQHPSPVHLPPPSPAQVTAWRSERARLQERLQKWTGGKG